MVSSFIGLAEGEQLNDSLLLINSVKGNEIFNVNSILDQGAEIDCALLEEPVNLCTPLRAACAQANVKIARLLLARGADVFAHFEADGWSALHSAAHSGHDHVVRMLITEVDSLHENTCCDGLGLLHLLTICLNSRLLDSGSGLVAWLLKQMPDADVNLRSQRPGFWDWTPLHMACAKGFVKASACLLKAKADLNAVTGDFHVGSANLNQFVQCDSTQADHSAGFNRVGPQWLDKGLLPIHLAAFGGNLRTLQLLVRHGQSINATTFRHCWTPLMFAVWSNNVPLVQEICRLGGRSTICHIDRRGDGSEWNPLSIAVVRGSPEMVQALIAYGADPLVRLSCPDFPGSPFIRYALPALPDGPENTWSGLDSRISLLHLAVQRGCVEMLRTLLPLVRAAHFSPVRSASSRPPLQNINPWQDASKDAGKADASRVSAASMASSCGFCGKSKKGSVVTSALVRSLDSSKITQDRARERLVSAPVSEGQDCDPVAFCTVEGWSPAVLALLLHVVDPQRKVKGCELLKAVPDKLAAPCTRADVFMELLGTGRSLLEDRPEASPPSMPQRFSDVSQTLAIEAINEFARLCKAGDADRVAYRILHTTLCVACRFNRQKVVRHLLESGLCDPCCPFLRPVECRPLHIAAACGYGHLAQLLLEHKADPLEGDEHSEKPVFKLSRCYERQISDLKARLSELEAQLTTGDSSSIMGASFTKALEGPSRTGRKNNTATPVPMSQYDSLLHDSRM
ncbi:unnamed protein product [Polarella glacialis]|uniref:Uncharacterized protein n=1 Tax=Polarella glacialis TaxID=89957 RepID=A0A813JZM5_POLGL|nr:unnamed protein product [Polarella glacialis]|mmetsp:Transcript_72698/g.130921  ORF Transcript_72698/g.130921 Transcript_72698/m.130921 type:complete len:741 (+) Transcript_72698:124-2346(+)